MIPGDGGLDVSRETRERLGDYVELLLEENERQNLIARSTVPDIWRRHIADSAQLVGLAPSRARWIDIGSGPGLPGIVVAIISGAQITLVEPRRLRAEFLIRVAELLDLGNVNVETRKAQSVTGQFDVVTARAVASAVDLFGITSHLTHSRTKYLLMKGRNAKSELEEAGRQWQGDFQLIGSATDPDAAILLAENVRRRG